MASSTFNPNVSAHTAKRSRWDSQFHEPIELADGRLLRSLRDAGNYITRLSKDEHDVREWQTAMHMLIEAADRGGPVSFARLGVSQALHRGEHPNFDASRKQPHWRKRVRS